MLLVESVVEKLRHHRIAFTHPATPNPERPNPQPRTLNAPPSFIGYIPPASPSSHAVPEKAYSIWLDAHTCVVVELTTFDGRVVSFVVRLMHTFSGGEKCVARYDTAHGCPHLDIVDGKGRLLEKKWLLGMGLAEALLFAVEDFKNGYEDYIKDFRA